MNSAHGNGKDRRRWRWLALATVVFFVMAGIIFVMVPVQKSKKLEQSLLDQFGRVSGYTPAGDGFVRPERLVKFIRVREAVQPNCLVFQGILDSVMKLEEVESNPDLSAGQKASEGIDSFKTMFSAAPGFLEFMDARNSSLLNEEMGLGEYFYIYLAAYGPQLASEAQSRYAGQEEAHLSQRARDEYIQLLGNQLTALDTTSQDAVSMALATTLQAEISSLRDGSHTSPWPEGPPATTRDSLAPYREQLDGLYCQGIVEIELLQKNRGLDLRN